MLNIPIIFEDKDLLVINKPSGITVHPAPGEKDETVVEFFAKKIGIANLEDMLIHRLDKGTSGVMLISKNTKAREFLQKQFRDRVVKKEYLVLVAGKLEPKNGTIDLPIIRNAGMRNKMSVGEDGRKSSTDYEVIKYSKYMTYLRALPNTGRTHQIRVHFSMIGFPVAGDARYGRKNDDLPRIFLHAEKISFISPSTGKTVTFSADLPKELEGYLERLD